jgi:hypothetical protein
MWVKPLRLCPDTDIKHLLRNPPFHICLSRSTTQAHKKMDKQWDDETKSGFHDFMDKLM